MMKNVELLQFDTDLFGYQVGRLFISGDVNFKIEVTNDFKLIYVISDSEIPAAVLPVGCTHADTRVLWQKSITETLPSNNMIMEYNSRELEPLKELALQSGGFSRFKTDKKFQHHEFEKLYSVWLKKIVNGELADVIFVCDILDEVEGFISVKKYNDFAEIGLIAVNSAHRGKNIGKNLMIASENWAFTNNKSKMTVTTQEVNEQAMRFYESCGYQVVKKQFIYHYWI